MAATPKGSAAFLLATVVLLGIGALLPAAGTSTLASSSAKSLPVLRTDWIAGVKFLISPPTLDTSLDPAVGPYLGPAYWINANLVRLLPSGQVAADLATWKVSKSGLLYTFTIRKNARFSNGHPVTGRDVVFSFERALSQSQQGGAFDLIRGVDAFSAGKAKSISGLRVTGTRTLQITITQRAATFLAALTFSSAMILDRRVIAGKPIAPAINYLTTTCVANQGAGPFKLLCRNTGSTQHSFYTGRTPMYTLVPNPFYYGPKPRIALELPVLPSPDDGYRQYLAGKLDVARLPLVYLHRWKGKSKEYLEFPSAAMRFLMPNIHAAPFDNLHCRLAAAYAIDRETIAQKVLGGTKEAAYTMVPRGMPGYYSGKQTLHYDRARARAELARCPNRTVPFQLVFSNLFLDIVNLNSAVVSELAAIGMNVVPRPLPPHDYLQIISQPLAKTGTQLVHLGWGGTDPQDFADVLLTGQPTNLGAWHNPAYDRLVRRADVTLNRKTRLKLYIQAQRIALSQGAWISVAQDIFAHLVKPYVHGLVGNEGPINMGPRNGSWANVSVSKH